MSAVTFKQQSAAAQTCPEMMTANELRDHLHQHLQQTGILSKLGTQLRAHVLSEIAKSGINAAKKDNKKSGGGATGFSKDDATNTSVWSAGLADRLVEAHLRQTARPYSHTLYCSEANQSVPTHDGELCAAIDVPFPHENPRSYLRSPITALIEKVLKKRYAGSIDQCNTAVQTDDCPSDDCNAGLSMERRLALVDAQYALRYANHDFNGRASVEETLRHHRIELETLLKRDFETQMQTFRAGELVQMRREESERYALLSKHKMEEAAEFERTVTQRMELERQRLDHARADLEAHRNAIDKRGRGMLALAEERERAVAQLEKVINDQRDSIRKMQSHIAQLDELAAARLQEAESWRMREQRRTDDLRRLQGEQAAELKVRDDENAELRYKIKVLTEEYRNHMDRMSLDYRLSYQKNVMRNENTCQHYADPKNSAVVVGLSEANENNIDSAGIFPSGNSCYPEYKTLFTQIQEGSMMGQQHGDYTTLQPQKSYLQQQHYQQQQPVPQSTTAQHHHHAKTTFSDTNQYHHHSNSVLRYTGGTQQQQQQQAVPSTAAAQPSNDITLTTPVTTTHEPVAYTTPVKCMSNGSYGNVELERSPSPIKNEVTTTTATAPTSAASTIATAATTKESVIVMTEQTKQQMPVHQRTTSPLPYRDKKPSPSPITSTPTSQSTPTRRTPSSDGNINESTTNSATSNNSSERKRRPVLDKTKEEKAKRDETLSVGAAAALRVELQRISVVMSALQNTTEPMARNELLMNEGIARINLIATNTPQLLITLGLFAEEDRMFKGLLWGYNSMMTQLKAQRDAARNPAGFGMMITADDRPLMQDSDDNSDDGLLYRKGSDNESF